MRTLGVIGGLGAESTIEYYRLLVSAGGFGRRRDTHCPPRTEALYPRKLSQGSPFRSIMAPVSMVTCLRERLDILWVTVKSHTATFGCRKHPQRS
jgi:hypothetical protein